MKTPLNTNKKDDLDVYYPYSRITCFILYLYSMELGDPPLFAELNRITRQNDLTQLENLGPMQRVLNEITWAAEQMRDSTDKMPTGKMIGGEDMNIAGIFLLYRGMKMTDE